MWCVVSNTGKRMFARWYGVCKINRLIFTSARVLILCDQSGNFFFSEDTVFQKHSTQRKFILRLETQCWCASWKCKLNERIVASQWLFVSLKKTPLLPTHIMSRAKIWCQLKLHWSTNTLNNLYPSTLTRQWVIANLNPSVYYGALVKYAFYLLEMYSPDIKNNYIFDIRWKKLKSILHKNIISHNYGLYYLVQTKWNGINTNVDEV